LCRASRPAGRLHEREARIAQAGRGGIHFADLRYLDLTLAAYVGEPVVVECGILPSVFCAAENLRYFFVSLNSNSS